MLLLLHAVPHYVVFGYLSLHSYILRSQAQVELFVIR